MRRFIAFIMLAVTILFGIGFSTPGMMKNANLSLDFTSGREFVYTVENINDDDDTTITKSQMNKLANDLSSRLNDAGVTKYEITIEEVQDTFIENAHNQIRVSVAQDYSAQYDHIKKLMSFNSSFTLATSDAQESSGESEFANNGNIFDGSTARVDFIGAEAYFVIPVTDLTSLKVLTEHASTLGSTSSSGEEKTSDEAKLILWSDFNPDTDTLENSKNEGNDDIANRILCMFDPASLNFNNDKNTIAIKITDNATDSNANAYELNANVAKMYANLFNAKNIDLKLTFLHDDYISPTAESFISFGKPNTLSASRTLLAIGVLLVIVAFAMIFAYRLQGFNAFLNVIITLFTTFAIFNAIGMTFNASALVAIVAVTILAIASSVIYIENFKNEVYRGRTLKKANTEAHKRSFITLIDIHILTLILAGIAYFVGQGAIASMAVAIVLGTLINFLVTVSINRLMTWLITNDTSLQTKYSYFKINKDLVPSLSDEEKQTYYGPYKNKDFTKNAKGSLIGTLVATVICIAAIVGFGVSGNGVVNNESGQSFTRAYYEIHEYADNKGIIIDGITYFQDKIDIDALKDANVKVDNITTFNTTDDNDEKTYYYVVDFTGNVNPETKVTINNSETTVNDYLSSLIVTDTTETDKMTLKDVRQTGTKPNINVSQPSLSNILIVTSILVGVSAVYVLIRYGLARGLANLIISIVVAFIPFGLFSLTRLEVTATTFVTLIAMVIINAILTIIIGAKAKEVSDDRKNVEVSIIDNNTNALSLAAPALIILSSITFALSVDFIGFGHPAFRSLFIVMGLGTIVVTLLDLVTFVPMQMFFIKLFGDVNVHLPKIAKKKKQKEVSGNIKGGHKSAEPEESLFPGIND